MPGPLYHYTFDVLISEEQALFGQPRWYEGSADGKTWMAQMAYKLIIKYNKR